MPFKSEKQRRFMMAVAHNPAFAQKVGVKPKVGQEFASASMPKIKEKLPKQLAEPKIGNPIKPRWKKLKLMMGQ